MSSSVPSISSLDYSEIIDWWELSRLNAYNDCFNLQNELYEWVEREIEGISYQDLFVENSQARQRLETKILKDISKLETRFLLETVKYTEQKPDVKTAGQNLSHYGGWTFWDIGKIFAGGGSAGGALLAGSRALPLALPVAGVAALAAPVTIVAGLAGMAWSAYSVSGQKRSQYLQKLKAGIEAKLTSTEFPEKSVLSGQMERLDALRDLRLRSIK